MEFPLPEDDTSEETELEKRVWPFPEKRETAGETGAEEWTVKGD